ncbi:MAG: aldo/keto reductase [Rhodospirillales bacterium]|nr:aldo/keto reductase [Rhodospirillales bacterium]
MAVLDRLGFGCVALTTLAGPRASRDLLEGVFELGLHHFDTAPVYGQGYSERLLGEFLRGKRDRVSVATKFGLSPSRAPRLPVGVAMGLNALRRLVRPPPARPSNGAPAAAEAATPSVEAAPLHRIGRAELQSAFDASRRSLGTDYIDLYLLHEHLPSSLESAALDFLLELRASGRVRQLGLAANGSRYLGLTPLDVADWDVLQYEFGPGWPAHAGLPDLFPAKTHIFHSCLKGVVGTGQAPGQVLARCLSANPSGRVLFSSTRLAHVRDNIQMLGT